MRLNRTRIVDDALYDELKIHASDKNRMVEVSGKHVPTVAIKCSPDAELNKFVPIGSRTAADLTMTIDGVEAGLLPGKGRRTRGSYRVELIHARTHYKFKPNSDASTQLIRDGTNIAEFSMDDEDGDFLVQWLAKRDDTQPADAAIGYALSVAFRTGAMGFFSLLVDFLADFPAY